MSLIAALALTLAAGAADTPPATATDDNPTDRMICESQEEMGSRLKKKKVCMRKSEWDAQRQQNRQMIERSQVQRATTGGG